MVAPAHGCAPPADPPFLSMDPLSPELVDGIMSSTLLRVSALLTGAVMAGEALALILGMHVLGSGSNPWVSLKNDVFLGLDLMAGLVIVVLAVGGRRLHASGWVYALVLISMVAHGYREWAYLARAGNAFCANAPLFAVNSVKLIGLLVIAAGAVALRLTASR